ncbi:MAG: SGNH/GDSL hydrolase family protein [Gemmatimonadales bacterium]|jgi:hypothetical protein|nr:MAG: SGNH/GDSL hydrolase family protein [Gemmatimonadales bacterium]
MAHRAACTALALLVVSGCGSTPSGPGRVDELPDTDIRVLFIGNSLTYTNDLPGAVATLSGALGHDVGTVTVASPNFALEDHWMLGVAQVIQEVQPDFVVMQQGPSSLPQNRAHLVAWTDTISRAIRQAGAQPALLMVWPSLDRYDFFDAVRESYRAAADQVNGIFVPAGEALRALYEGHPAMDPFSWDGFHPSEYGTLVAAMVVTATLFDSPVTGLPAQLSPPSTGGAAISVSPEAATILQQVADSVTAAWNEAAVGDRIPR